MASSYDVAAASTKPSWENSDGASATLTSGSFSCNGGWPDVYALESFRWSGAGGTGKEGVEGGRRWGQLWRSAVGQAGSEGWRLDKSSSRLQKAPSSVVGDNTLDFVVVVVVVEYMLPCNCTSSLYVAAVLRRYTLSLYFLVVL